MSGFTGAPRAKGRRVVLIAAVVLVTLLGGYWWLLSRSAVRNDANAGSKDGAWAEASKEDLAKAKAGALARHKTAALLRSAVERSARPGSRTPAFGVPNGDNVLRSASEAPAAAKEQHTTRPPAAVPRPSPVAVTAPAPAKRPAVAKPTAAPAPAVPALTGEEQRRATVLEEYRIRHDARVKEWKTKGFVEPIFCRGNALCDDSRRERAMYAKRRARMQTPDFQKELPKHECGANPITISLDHKIQSWWSHVTNPMRDTLNECPVKCAVKDHDADIVFTMVNPGHKSRPTQKTAIVSLESYKGHEGQNIDEAIANSADIVMSYSRSSDIWINYWYGLTGDHFNNCKRDDCLTPQWPPDMSPERERLHGSGRDTRLSPLFISNCHSGRGNYMKELMLYTKIDSYGGCFGTAGLPRAEQGRLPKQKLSREYKFHLAFENSILDDYVTEKLWDAWSYGAIPVYWGAPNAELYVPHPHSFINALDFETPKHLAEYLNALALNATAYAEFFEWQKRPLPKGQTSVWPEEFWKMNENNFTNRGRNSMLCKLCVLYSQRYCSDHKPSA